MTRDVAIRYCDEYLARHISDIDKEFLKIAKEALQQEPCEDCISRQVVLDVTWEEPSYTDALNVLTEVRDKVKALPPVNPQKPKSECEQDHEILKAYSDGASAVLDKVRLDIAQEIITKDSDEYDYEAKWQNMGLRIALKVIDKYKEEGSGE